MAYRYTNTDKWNDAWFVSLNKNQKLLFLYLCDNCDIAGFIEINFKRWQSDLGFNSNEIEGATKGLERGLILSNTNDCYYIKNFLKHQKNIPLNERNNAHLGILKRFDIYKNKFDINNINDFILAPSEPLSRGYGKGKGKSSIIINTWRDDFEIYKTQLRNAYNELIKNNDWISKCEKYNPNVNILLTIEKACVNYWATEAGWKKKKSTKTIDIDWESTLTNAISQPTNRVYLEKQKFGEPKQQTNIFRTTD